MTRRRFWLPALVSIAIAASGISACEQWGTTQQQINYQQCRWGVGCQARCAEGYEGYIPYCD